MMRASRFTLLFLTHRDDLLHPRMMTILLETAGAALSFKAL